MPTHLRDRLEAAQLNHRASVDALQSAVCEYADELRARGVPYEGVIMAVRKLMSDLDGDGDGGGRAARPRHDGHLLALMVEWCRENWHRPR
jgi:hypothetical protein